MVRSLLASTLLLIAVAPAFAQPPGVDPDTGAPLMQAMIAAPEDGPVGRTIILDASTSRVPGGDVRYAWYLEGRAEPFSTSVDAIFTPEKPGTVTFRLVIRATVGGKTMTSEASHSIVVYGRKIVLVADPTVPSETIEAYARTARDAGVYLRILRPEVPAYSQGGEESLRQVLSAQESALIGAETIVLMTEGALGLQGLMQAGGEGGALPSMERQTILLVTDRNIRATARTASGLFPALKPRRIVVTPPEAMTLLLTTESIDAFLARADRQDLPKVVLTSSTSMVRPWNLLSLLVHGMLTRGISSRTVILLLVLPIIATILCFLRQVVGLATFGLFAPSIVALSFLALGWKVGVLSLLAVVAAGYAMRAVMRDWHLLHIPKVAIILTVNSILLLILLAVAASFRLLLTRDAVFILLIMSTLSESFLTVKTEQGWLSAVLSIAQTIGAALLCVFVVQWPSFQAMLLAYPELIFVTLLANVALGRYTGLRLVEYFRFREVFRHSTEE